MNDLTRIWRKTSKTAKPVHRLRKSDLKSSPKISTCNQNLTICARAAPR